MGEGRTMQEQLSRAMPGAIAEDRCDWAQGWTESNSRSYWLKEAQVQLYMDKPGPGNW